MQQFIEINGIQVDKEILKAKFACDYDFCAGACCYDSTFCVAGAPLTSDEAHLISSEVQKMNVPRNVKESPYLIAGDIFYTAMDKKSRCVFCDEEGCMLKKTIVGIPSSCHLYPLVFAKGVLYIDNYYRAKWCKMGYKKGKKDNVLLIDFMKDAIIKTFGEAFYNALKHKG